MAKGGWGLVIALMHLELYSTSLTTPHLELLNLAEPTFGKLDFELAWSLAESTSPVHQPPSQRSQPLLSGEGVPPSTSHAAAKAIFEAYKLLQTINLGDQN